MIRLSPTAVLKYETCPYQYLLEEVLRIRPAHRAANLVFGTVLHRTVEDWLRGDLTGAAPDRRGPNAQGIRDFCGGFPLGWLPQTGLGGFHKRIQQIKIVIS